jgi:hypothetical protein
MNIFLISVCILNFVVCVSYIYAFLCEKGLGWKIFLGFVALLNWAAFCFNLFVNILHIVKI